WAASALAGAGAAAGLASCFGASAAGAGAGATAPSSMTATTCWLVTTSPAWNLISLSTPSTGAGTSSTTLSVSRSSRFSSRRTVSPAFLCQLAMVASDTDSGRTGTLTSMLMDEVLAALKGLFGSMAVGRVDEGVLDQRGLFGIMGGKVAAGGRGRTGAAGIAQRLPLAQAEIQMVADLVPGTLVHRLLLAPHHFPGGGEALELGCQRRTRERVQLLDADHGHVLDLLRGDGFDQVPVDLAAADHDPARLLRILATAVRDQLLEATLAQLVQGRDRQLVPQHGLGRHHHQRLADAAQHLPAQHVEHLRRGG